MEALFFVSLHVNHKYELALNVVSGSHLSHLDGQENKKNINFLNI